LPEAAAIAAEPLTGIDEQLRPLLPAVALAIEGSRLVAVLQTWRRIRCLALLPFHLHLRWPDALRALPLASTAALVPFTEADLLLANTPLYGPRDVGRARRTARTARLNEKRDLPLDLRPEDWEQGLSRHPEVANSELPGSAYVAVDRVTPDGECLPGHRSLGRIAVRNAPRPFIRVPPRSELGPESAVQLADVDLLLINVQGLRGRRLLDSARSVVTARGRRRPTVVVASSPSDLLALGLVELAPDAELAVVGSAPELLDVQVTEVGRDRLAAERQFAFAFEDRPVGGAASRHLVDLARFAWWASRQSLCVRTEEIPEVRRFQAALRRLSEDSPTEAAELAGGWRMIEKVMTSADGAAERRSAVLRAILETGGGGSLLVTTRDAAAAESLRGSVAERLDLPVDSLESLGVHVQSHWLPASGSPVARAIACGYFGLTTFDVMLGSRAPFLHFTLDPVEARAAFYGARRLIEYMNQLRVPGLCGPLVRIQQVLAQHAPGVAGGTIEFSPLPATDAPQFDGWLAPQRSKPAPGEVLVILSDGTALMVSAAARFEILGHVGGRMRKVAAAELQTGDEIVLLHEDARVLFSDRLIAAIDSGPLHQLAAERSLWLTVVKAIYNERPWNLADVTRRMSERGQPVDYATVRSWVTFESEGEAAVPETLQRFLAFATAFGMSRPLEELKGTFHAIRRLRALHRLIGRELARAIRAAYLDRLDASTLAKIERDWGLTARQLLQAARVATVDEVILPEGVADGVD
jgi:hypothetical protein